MNEILDQDKELEMWHRIEDFVLHRDMAGLMSLCTYYVIKYSFTVNPLQSHDKIIL